MAPIRQETTESKLDVYIQMLRENYGNEQQATAVLIKTETRCE